jgi:large subunit ribosomal protein L21
MKLAVIKTGGKQYVARETAKIKIEKLEAAIGDVVTFDTLMVADGDNVEIGTPMVTTKVEGKVLKHARTKKVIGVKYKPKTRENTKYGHRQNYTEVEITKI